MATAPIPPAGVAPGATHEPGEWIRLLSGLVAVYLLFQLLASWLHSDHGQAGIVIALAVTAALVLIERFLFGRPPRDALRALGLGRPAGRGLLAALLVGLGMVAVLPLFSLVTQVPVRLLSTWLSSVPGLFAQAGIAEEVLFRGYLFRHLRATRPFWPAAWASALPFIGVHLVLFASMPWPVALSATLLAVATSFPLAHLFEVGGNTIWAPALVHFAIQGGIKVVAVEGDASLTLAVVWMAAAALLPFASFLVRRRP